MTAAAAPGELGMEERGPRTLLRALALVGQLGFTVAGGVAAGVAAGWVLDGWAGTRFAFKVGGMLLGLGGGAIAAYRLVVGFLRDDGR